MKKQIIALLFFLFLFSCCFADGGMMVLPDYTKSVFMPEQKAVIIWDGSKEQMIIESKITVEDLASLAWLIPIESSTKPVVETADEQIFFDLADLFKIRPKSRGMLFGMPGTMMGGIVDEGVEVIEELKLDIYDITVLRATDEMALINWLNENGYSFPTAFPSLLSNYVKSGSFYFVANKINLQNKYKDLVITSQDFECAQQMSGDEYLGYMFAGGRESIERRISDLMDNYDECNGANSKAVSVLVSLRLGIATPLKISFTPSKPFYPMTISSINPGQGDAKIYFAGKQPFKDSSGLFNTQNMLQVGSGSLSEYGINQGDYITLLGWQGNYYSLDKDSFFVETAFVPELDPNYVPFGQVISEFLFALLMMLVAALFISFFIIAIPFFLGILAAWLFEQRKKKASLFAEGNGVVGLLGMALIIIIGPAFFILAFMLPAGLLFGVFLGILIVLAFLFTPYYVSMACGFFFRKSKYKKRWLLGPIIIFALILFLLFILTYSLTP
jgi:hypothetical protein